MNNFYEKYGLITHGINRAYKVPINKRVYGYERCTLVLLKIEELELKDIAWNKAMCLIGKYLQENHKKPISELKEFKVKWANGIIFADAKFQQNCCEIESDVWFNTGYASTHGIMLIQDLIEYYGIDPDKCEIIVHLPSMSEAEEVTKFYKTKIVESFKDYLLDENLSEKASESVIRGINTLNRILVKMNFGANDFYLVDDRQTLSNLKGKCLQYCKVNCVFNDSQLKLAERFLNYYSKFFYEYDMKLKVEERILIS